MWTEPFLEIGFDENNKKSWGKWSAPETDRWQNVPSWFDEYRPERLSVFWLNFSKQIEDLTWGETLKRGIRWYISANLKAGGLDGSIVLAQTAHEMLAWTKFVSEIRSYTADGFDVLPAVSKLRLILSEAKIPLQTPSLLKFLFHLCRSRNWVDGAQAITAIRNKLVHPSPKNIQTLQRIGIDEMYDAHTLTMWYLELVLLFLLGYKDEYSNRLIYSQQAGKTEPVPWA